MLAVTKEIRGFVIDNFLFGQDRDSFSNEDSFLDNGLIDSMGILMLVEFVKERFSVSIDDEEIVPDNFDSVLRVATFVQNKMEAGQSRSFQTAGTR